MIIDIKKIISQMSLKQKVGQMFMANICGGENIDQAKRDIEKYHFGGLQFSSVFERFVRGGDYKPCGVCENKPLEEVAQFLHDIKQASLDVHGVPVIIGGDQEGGVGSSIFRRRNITLMPSQMGLGQAGNPELTYQANLISANEVKLMGLDMIYGPCLDVNTNPLNPEIGIRSFGEDPSIVAEHGAAVIRACNDAGIISNAKHFPGRGHGYKNAHHELEKIGLDMNRLESVELFPFRRAISEGVDSIMLAHTIFPAIDAKLPASLSPTIVNYLRGQMGFEGVIIPDTLTMFAIASNYKVPQAAALCIEAGADMIFMKVRDLYQPCIDAIIDSINKGRLSEERIDKSVERILKLKLEKKLFELKPYDSKCISESIGCQEHVDVMSKIHSQSQKILKDTHVKLNADARLLVVQPRDMNVVIANDDVIDNRMLARAISKQGFSVSDIVIDEVPTVEQSFEVIAKSKNVDAVIWGVYSGSITNEVKIMLDKVAQFGKPVILILAATPYAVKEVPASVQKVICTFGLSPLGFEKIVL